MIFNLNRCISQNNVNEFSYQSPDTLMTIRRFNRSHALSKTISENRIEFLVMLAKYELGSIEHFKVTFTLPACCIGYNKDDLNGNEAFAGYNPTLYGKWSDNNRKLTFDIPRPITKMHPRIIWFHILPYLNGNGRIRADFEYTDSNGKTIKGVVYSGNIESVTPKVDWVVNNISEKTYCISGRIKYGADYLMEVPITNNSYELTLGRKKIKQRCFNLGTMSSSSTLSGVITHYEGNQGTSWHIEKKFSNIQVVSDNKNEIQGDTMLSNLYTDSAAAHKHKYQDSSCSKKMGYGVGVLYDPILKTFQLDVDILTYFIDKHFSVCPFAVSLLSGSKNRTEYSWIVKTIYNYKIVNVSFGGGYGYFHSINGVSGMKQNSALVVKIGIRLNILKWLGVQINYLSSYHHSAYYDFDNGFFFGGWIRLR
jgi:hypothetical protein